jgi:hypothetical protein
MILGQFPLWLNGHEGHVPLELITFVREKIAPCRLETKRTIRHRNEAINGTNGSSSVQT